MSGPNVPVSHDGSTAGSLAAWSGPDLVERALADPVGVLGAYEAELVGAPARRAVELLRAAGVAAREQRDLERSEDLLDEARRLALDDVGGDTTLVALVELSLAATVLYRGDARRAIELVDAAARALTGEDRFLALCQRAGILHRAGRVPEALRAFDEAFAARGEEPSTALAELHNNRGILLGYLGRLGEAAADISTARELFTSFGQARRAVDMTHNLGWLAGRRGDVVGALALFDAAERSYAELGLPADAVLPDRCEVLLAAGLATEALAVAQRSADALAASGDAADQAEALVLSAQIALRLGDHALARDAATRAAVIFTTSGRTPWAEHARALVVEAGLVAGDLGDDVLVVLDEIRAALADGDLAAAVPEVDLLRVRVLLAAGRTDEAADAADRFDVAHLAAHLRPAARAVRARVHVARGDDGQAWEELHRGADELDGLRDALGAAELRASVGLHADDVLRVGLDLALQGGDPSDVLQWSDRGRARSLHHPRVAPVPDDLAGSLHRARRVDRARRDGEADDDAWRDAVDDVRRSSRQRARRDSADDPRSGLDPVALRAALGHRFLVQLVDHGTQMRAVLVDGHGEALVDAGPAAAWYESAAALRRSLVRVISGRGDARVREAAVTALEANAQAMDERVAPLLDIASATAPIVLVPPAGLHAAPWGALASLVDRAWSLAPSAASWIACVARRRPLHEGAIAAIAGPGLANAPAEVQHVREAAGARSLPLAVDAACDEVVDAFGQAAVVHLACHGRFVADNPLLSALELTDGPFYVHDVERAAGCPAVVVLSACSAGLSAQRPADELLGFTSALLGAGAASVVASSIAVPDGDALVGAMLTLHAALAAGTGVGAALREVRTAERWLGAAFAVHGDGG